MRTKAMILTAAVLAAGVASSMAQSNVYSLNVVGYVNVPIVAGFNMIDNPLDDGMGDTLTNVIPGNGVVDDVAGGSTFYPWSGSGYGNAISYFTGFGWYDANLGGYATNTIPPGAGFFLYTPTPTNITFVGTVPQGTNSRSLPAGFTLTASTYPLAQQPGYSTDGSNYTTMELPVNGGDTLYLFTNSTGYYAYSYFDGYGWYDGNNPSLDPGGPLIGVGQGFFLSKSIAATWTQSFTVQ